VDVDWLTNPGTLAFDCSANFFWASTPCYDTQEELIQQITSLVATFSKSRETQVAVALGELQKQLKEDTEESGKHLDQLGSEAMSSSSKLEVVTLIQFPLI
jgi:hypothetical protein